ARIAPIGIDGCRGEAHPAQVLTVQAKELEFAASGAAVTLIKIRKKPRVGIGDALARHASDLDIAKQGYSLLETDGYEGDCVVEMTAKEGASGFVSKPDACPSSDVSLAARGVRADGARRELAEGA
ncbi:unnamed protein product, partial [Prorocentrum cordatum]